MNKLTEKIMRNKEKGFVLISAYLIVSSMMTLSLALWTQSFSFLLNSEASIYKAQAFHVAESGLDATIVNLENDLTYTGDPNGVYTKNGTTLGTYSSSVETPDALDPYLKRVTTTATTPALDANGRGQVTRTTVTYVRLIPPQPFEFAFFADKGITLNGSPAVYIDSYDSKNGPYAPGSANANADVATNSVINSTVALNGNVTIKGDVDVGVGGNPSSVIYVGPNSSITGSKGQLNENKVYTPPEVPKSAIPLGAVSLSAKQVLTLNGGTYVMDSLSVTGQGQINVTDQTTVYITGSADIAGNGVVTANDRPRNFIVHVVGNSPLNYSGNSELYAGIYAPKSEVKVSGNGEVFGAVISDSYTQTGNGKFHFDEDLKTSDANDKLRAEIVSWQEMNKFYS